MDKKPDNRETDIDMDEIEKNLERIWEREVRDYIEDEDISVSNRPENLYEEKKETANAVTASAAVKKTKKTVFSAEERKHSAVSSDREEWEEERIKAETAKKKKKQKKEAQNKKRKEEQKEKQKAKQRDEQIEKQRQKDKQKDRQKDKQKDKQKEREKERKEKKIEIKEKKEREKLKKEKKPEKKSGLRRFLTFLLVLLLLLGAAWYLLISGIYGKMEYKPLENFTKEPVKSEGVVNILLIGTDARSTDEEGRSDAMILLSVSQRTKTVHMTSLLRDMYVEIPGHDGNRLNAAYSFGGPELLLETVEQNFGIEVNRYAVVNFEAFANLVDAVEGIDLELTNEEVQWVNAYLNEYNMLRDMPIETDYLDTSLSGVIHLNGPQALAYTRNRYIGTDFGRTERQRKVLAEVIRKLPVGMVKNPVELTNGLFTNLTTNLTKGECLNLSLLGGKLITYDVIQGSMPVEGSYKDSKIRGMAVLEVDFEQNRQYLQREIYGEK